MGDWLGLSRATVVVTGAAGGIGQALVAAFVGAGARVAALDLLAPRADGDVLAVSCDVADGDSVARAAAAVRAELGPARVLVNNAAVLAGAPLLTIDPAEWSRVLGVNLTGYLLCSQSFGSQMVEGGGGSIVHVASIGGHFARRGGGAYCVSKAGVRLLSQVLALELGPVGVRSNVLSPGMVDTPMSASSYADPKRAAARAGAVPLGRIGQPADNADVALWLASDRSSYINGEEVLVDGGLARNLMAQLP